MQHFFQYVRSNIHGRGLFCKRDIDAGEMIIEYAGEVIRNALTDLREKYYESKVCITDLKIFFGKILNQNVTFVCLNKEVISNVVF